MERRVSGGDPLEQRPFVAPRAGGVLVLAPGQAKAVARRAKTQLRRLTRLVTVNGGATVMRRCGAEVGQTFRVLSTTQADALARRDSNIDTDPLAVVKVTGVVLQRLADMTVDDARAEGHQSLAGFADWWMRRHDHSWPPQEPKICRECGGHAEYADQDGVMVACPVCDFGEVTGDMAQTPAQILGRFATFDDRQVWVVTFELDERRFMHRDSTRRYTSDPAEAMFGEPEVLGEPLPRWRVSAEARRRAHLAEADEMRLSGLVTHEDRLEEFKRIAAERDVDISSDVRVIEQRLAQIGRKVQRDRRSDAA